MSTNAAVRGEQREPHRIAGAVQSYGLFLAADPVTLRISHASENSERLIAVKPRTLLGRSLADVLTDSDLSAALDVISSAGEKSNPTVGTIGDQAFDVITHRHGESLFVELEPPLAVDDSAITAIRNVMHSMAMATSATELWARTALGVRKITGYDRVDISYFHPDGHGEVVGAAQAHDVESHLGVHFPASNIPDQPSRSYLTKPSRLIANSRDVAVAVIVDSSAEPLPKIDVSAAVLGAPSVHDLRLMEQLGYVSTFSLTVVRNGALIGVISCGHRSERRLSYRLRDALELVANQLSLQFGAMEEIHRLRQRELVRETRSVLATSLTEENDVVTALLHGDVTLLDFIPADGAAVRISGKTDSIGTVPDRDVLEHLPELVAETGGAADVCSDAVPLELPALAPHMPHVAGLLVRQLGSGTDYLAWFRRESVSTIDWIRDLSTHTDASAEHGPLLARQPDNPGTSIPWTTMAGEASELRRSVETALLNRARAELADLALRDPLTGLPNRRALVDALDRRLASETAARPLALLFVDIDHFKSINDQFGHAAGDAALIHVSSLLQSTARDGDVIARLGGDEFVVLIDGATDRDADRIAGRIIAAIRAVPADGSPWRVTASVGVTFALPGQDASDLLNAADTAMFRAKVDGRDRASL